MKTFKLFANCIVVKGAKNNIICDVQRSIYRSVDSNVVSILEACKDFSVEEIKAQFDIKDHYKIDGFLDKLVSEEYGFYTNTPEAFPTLNTQWENPFIIHNAIIDYDKLDWKYILKFMNNLVELGCAYLQLRCYSSPKIQFIKDLLEVIEESRIRALDIIVPFQFINENMLNEIDKLTTDYYKLHAITVTSSPYDKFDETMKAPISYIKQSIVSHKNCGLINPAFFALDIDVFFEGHQFNTCLNKKISMDINGNIKNCPSMDKSFGNIKDTGLKEVIDHPDFKKLWNINKDKIHVCKDCEFRYICTDCRAYIEDPKDILSKPLKCGYNPYTGEWSEWSTNPLKQKAIEYYGMEDLVEK